VKPLLSIIIPTHSPHPGRLERTLAGLQAQTFPRDCWELLLIDNASPEPAFFDRLDLSWHPKARVVREERLGLTQARLAGMRSAVGVGLIYVDDDNVLAPEYLREADTILADHPRLGVLGGKSLPEWEAPPEPWVLEFASCLALRDLGDKERIGDRVSDPGYPLFAPVGAGMVLRRAVVEDYALQLARGLRPTLSDRRGQQLTSGGDNALVLAALEAGWQVGYFPQLSLRHLIPAGRTTRDYLGRLNHGIARSWVQVLASHGICPWPAASPWLVWPRKLRAYWTYRAWRDAAAYVRWCGACGYFEGRALLGGPPAAH